MKLYRKQLGSLEIRAGPDQEICGKISVFTEEIFFLLKSYKMPQEMLYSWYP